MDADAMHMGMHMEYIFLLTLSSLCILLFVYLKFGLRPTFLMIPKKKEDVPKKIPAISAVYVKNPFSLEISKIDSILENDGIILRLHTIKKCVIKLFWEVRLSDGQKCLLSSKHGNGSFPENLNSNKVRWLCDFLEKEALNSSCSEMIHPTVIDEFVYACKPDIDNPIQNTARKDRLAQGRSLLVAVVELAEDARDATVLNEDIVALVTVIDTKNDYINTVCSWFVSYQCIQTASGNIFELKNLFSSGVPDNFVTSETEAAAEAQDLCIICHSFPVTRAFLPCRHNCICGVCFNRTKLCPVCRNTIQSFIVTGDESQLPEPVPDENELQEQTRRGLSNMGIVELFKAIWNAS